MKQDRMARVNRLVQSVLAELVPGRIKDPRVQAAPLVAVTAVRTTPDLRWAKVYLSVSGDAEQQQAALAGLQAARGYLRRELGQRVRMRNTPELQFELDGTVEAAARIEGILEQLAKERVEDE